MLKAEFNVHVEVKAEIIKGISPEEMKFTHKINWYSCS